MTDVDAVVVGGGHNGLVAANLLVDAGWDVTVVESAARPGGAVRSEELTLPGFVHDVFSGFYPLGVASPVLRALDLERYGLQWESAPVAVAHPQPDGSCPLVSSDPEETLANLRSLGTSDSASWERLYELWQRCGEDVITMIMSHFPPVSSGLRLAARLGIADSLRFARFTMLPLRQFQAEEKAPHLALLFAGNALHADLSPELPLGTFFGWLLCSLGQDFGFPVPAGGAERLIHALVARLEERGGSILRGNRVTRIEVKKGVATGVVCADGTRIGARRAVIAAISAPAMYRDLVGYEHLSARTRDDLTRFHQDNGTFKVDWALRDEVPWAAEAARRASTVHVADDLDHLSEVGLQLALRVVPARPYLVIGQPSAADSSRSQPGTSTVWAYTHVPLDVRDDAAREIQGRWDEKESAVFADRIEMQMERLAPGFRERILARHVLTPLDFQARNESLPMGALNGGTAQLHQQLFFRPVPGLGGPRTPIARLYLGSSSAHPGGGVHGAPGANAARTALLSDRLRRAKPFLAAAALAAVVPVINPQRGRDPVRRRRT